MDRISVVLAQWCPHCVPLSLEQCQRIAKELRAELRVLDIDDAEQIRVADDLVKQYGDFADDYLVPQVFFEENGKIQHVFTGFSEGVKVTEARWDDFFAGKFYQAKLKQNPSVSR